MATRGRPPKGASVAQVMPLAEGMGMLQRGALLGLLGWQETGHEVPYDDIAACCAIAQAVTRTEQLATTEVVEAIFTPEGYHPDGGVRNVTQRVRNDVTQGVRNVQTPGCVTLEQKSARRNRVRNAVDGNSNPPVSGAERAASTRARREELRDLLAEVGVRTTSRMSLKTLEKLCRHGGMNIPWESDDTEGVRNEETLAGARVCVLNNIGINTEFNTSLLNTHSSNCPARARDIAATLRNSGFPEASAAHPTIVALAAAGAEPEEVRLAAFEATAVGKGLAYALGIARNRRQDALALAQAAPQPPRPPAPPPPPEPPHEAVPPPDEVRARLDALLNRGLSLVPKPSAAS